MAITIVERKVGEYGNSLLGTLDDEAGLLVLSETDTVTLSATRTDTGARVIDAEVVVVVDAAQRLVRYDWRDQDLAAALAGVTLSLEFAIAPAGDAAKPIYVPDKRANRLLLTVISREAA